MVPTMTKIKEILSHQSEPSFAFHRNLLGTNTRKDERRGSLSIQSPLVFRSGLGQQQGGLWKRYGVPYRGGGNHAHNADIS